MSAEVSNMKMARLPKRTLACLRHVGAYKGNQELFVSLFNKIIKWAGPRGLLKGQGVEAISVYHNATGCDPEDQEVISVGFTVPSGTKVEGDIEALELPESLYVIGSFEILPNEYENAWDLVFDFIKKQNLVASKEIMYELYKNDPQTHPEGKHIVDICVAVEG